MKDNILLVGLHYEFTGQVAKDLSNKFDMFFLDVNQLIEYSLIDTKNIQLICGKDYFENQKKQVILSVKQYENTIINFPYSVYLEDNMVKEMSENAFVIYLKLTKSQIKKLNKENGEFNIEELAFAEISKLLEKKSDLSIKCADLSVENAINSIIDAMKQKL